MYSVDIWDEISESWICEWVLEDSDYIDSKEELIISAKNGDHIAMLELFNLSIEFEKDIGEGVGWLEESAEAGNLEAQVKLADLCLLGFDLKTGYGSEEKDQDIYNFVKNKDVSHWLLKAANQNHIGSMFELADHYAKSDKEVFEWYIRATSLGGEGAEERLAYMYLYGKGVKPNKKLAFQWLERSFEFIKGRRCYSSIVYQNTLFYLGFCYYFGCGVEENKVEAFKYYAMYLQDKKGKKSKLLNLKEQVECEAVYEKTAKGVSVSRWVDSKY